MMLMAGSVHAEKYLESYNKAGGKILLTGIPCKDTPSMREMLSTAPSKPTLFGCWAYVMGEIHVVYRTGDKYTYALSEFRLVEDKE